MNSLTAAIGTTIIACLTAALPAEAQHAKPEFNFNASAGYQHDSNVNIAELDANTGEADNALLLGLGFDARLPVSDQLRFTLGYGYTSNTYETFSEFDLAMHHLKAAVGYSFYGFDSGLSVDHFAALLDGEDYLHVTQVAPNLSRLIGDKLYLRGSYIAAEKTYTDRPGRDADNDALRADVYILFRGMEQFLAFSYVMDSEDALASEFDYKGIRSRIAYGHRLEFGRANFDLRTHLQFENRDYLHASESIGAPRRDERFRAGASAAVALSEHFELRGEAEYADTASNFEAADFDETVYSVNIGMKF